MPESCPYVNQHGVRCGRRAHPESPNDHQLYEQLVMPDPFCLQPWDPCTLGGIRVWIITAQSFGVSKEKIQRAEQHYKDIAIWQKKNGTRLPG